MVSPEAGESWWVRRHCRWQKQGWPPGLPVCAMVPDMCHGKGVEHLVQSQFQVHNAQRASCKSTCVAILFSIFCFLLILLFIVFFCFFFLLLCSSDKPRIGRRHWGSAAIDGDTAFPKTGFLLVPVLTTSQGHILDLTDFVNVICSKCKLRRRSNEQTSLAWPYLPTSTFPI